MDDIDKSVSKWKISTPAAVALVIAMLLAGLFGWARLHSTDASAPGASTSAEQDNAPSDAAFAPESQSGKSAKPLLVVHIAGEVTTPGIVELPEGSRVADAINLAGGPAEQADLQTVNLARVVTDGEQIVVGSKSNAGAENSSSSASPLAETGASTQCININQADAQELQQLNGVGPALAQRIIEHRNSYGSFSSNESLAEVSGIGAKILERISKQLC